MVPISGLRTLPVSVSLFALAIGDRLLLQELGFKIKPGWSFLGEDNNAVLCQLSQERPRLERTRHIRAMYWNTMDYIEAGDLKGERVPTADMIADYLTKHLPALKTRRFVSEIMGDIDGASPGITRPIMTSIMNWILQYDGRPYTTQVYGSTEGERGD